MSVPKTRIPRTVRRDVWLAFACWRDYLAAIGNTNGASAAADIVKVLGLEPLEPIVGVNRFSYQNPQLKRMVENRERYGPR
jgi:hypothetical protein